MIISFYGKETNDLFVISFYGKVTDGQKVIFYDNLTLTGYLLWQVQWHNAHLFYDMVTVA